MDFEKLADEFIEEGGWQGSPRIAIELFAKWLEEHEAAQHNAHLTLGSRPVFCVCCGGEVSHPVCTDCLPSPAQVA